MPVYEYRKNAKRYYYAELFYIDKFGNRKRKKKRGFETAKSAKKWLAEIAAVYSDDNAPSEITFQDLFELRMNSKKNKIKDRSHYDLTSMFNAMILPYWKNKRVNEISLKDIVRWQDHLLSQTYTEKGNTILYSNSYLESVQSAFKTVLRYAVNNKYMTDHTLLSFEIVKHPNEFKKQMLFWEPDEFKRFIAVVDDVEYNTFFNLLYMCGLRRGEALALNWNDINFESKTVYIGKTFDSTSHKITPPKTNNSYRYILLPNRCYECLQVLYDVHKSTVGFSNDKFVFGFDKPFDDNTITRKKDYWIHQAGVKRIRLHDFRHSHVSFLIHQGFSAFDIAKRLGHTVDMVNNVYGHWFKEVEKNMVDAINDNF